MAPVQVARARNTLVHGSRPHPAAGGIPCKVGMPFPRGRSMSSTPLANPGPERGDSVRLRAPVAYLKTADPMPMLRPPELVDPEEIGVVVERRARDQLAVRFRRGTFLVSSGQLELLVKAVPPER